MYFFKALTVVLAVCVSVARSQYYYQQQQQPLYTTRQERASPPAPPPYKPAPPPPYAPHPPPSYGPAAYAFDWKVLDDYTKNNYGHQVGRCLFDFMEKTPSRRSALYSFLAKYLPCLIFLHPPLSLIKYPR